MELSPLHVVQVAYTGNGPWRDIFKSSNIDVVREKMHAFDASPLYAEVRIILVEEVAPHAKPLHQQ